MNPFTGIYERLLLRNTELVNNYQQQLFWFYWWIEQRAMDSYRKSFSFYYNKGLEWNKGVVINIKILLTQMVLLCWILNVINWPGYVDEIEKLNYERYAYPDPNGLKRISPFI